MPMKLQQKNINRASLFLSSHRQKQNTANKHSSFLYLISNLFNGFCSSQHIPSSTFSNLHHTASDMWSNNNRIPIHSGPQDRPIQRHHTARYYAHRVKESLTTRVSKFICAIFLFLLFIIGLIAFILWLSLRPHRPRIHVAGFSIPDLGHEGGFQNAQIIYNFTARNTNQKIGVFYDSMELTVYYQDQSIGGSPLLFPFYQEPKNTTVITGALGGASLTVTSQRWQQFIAEMARGEVVFRAEITSTIRFKISTWGSKRHKMHANCPVGVGPDGLILPSYRDRRCPVYFS